MNHCFWTPTWHRTGSTGAAETLWMLNETFYGRRRGQTWIIFVFWYPAEEVNSSSIQRLPSDTPLNQCFCAITIWFHCYKAFTILTGVRDVIIAPSLFLSAVRLCRFTSSFLSADGLLFYSSQQRLLHRPDSRVISAGRENGFHH